MASKEIPFYNVDSAVGPGCPNKRTDVMLVQYFLRRLYYNSVKQYKPDGPPVEVTGVCDDRTKAWILFFQKELTSTGNNVLVDGRVDPGKQGQLSAISRTGYTIEGLNVQHAKRYRKDHDYLELSPNVPAELRSELQQYEPKPVLAPPGSYR